MNLSLFAEYYTNDVIPSAKTFRKGNKKHEKVLYNATPHPIAEILNKIDKYFKIMFLSANATEIVQPNYKTAGNLQDTSRPSR